MLKSSIIRIAAALTGALLVAGCAAKLDDPAQDGAPIGFSAGSTLLRDDVTVKSGTPKTGTTFTTGDQLAVFGWHNAASELMTFGSTTPVTLGSNGLWTYAPIKLWMWQGNTDYYDFLAIHPYASSPVVSSGPLTATVTYDPTTAQYDLMTAYVRRLATDADPCSTVSLAFSHRTAAVRVKVTNDTGGQTFRLDACHYRNLYVGAKATSVYQNNIFKFTWSDFVRSGSDLLGSAPTEDLVAEAYKEMDYDLMIPQDLSALGSTPSMVLSYTPKTGKSTYGDTITSVIPLKNIVVQGTSTPIEEWVEGTLYTYNITIRIGGGVVVNVITTPWEVVEAETPGIMI